MPSSSYPLYYDAKEKNQNSQIILSEDEEKDRRNDHAEIIGMKEHHEQQHNNWTKAGNFYNIVQSSEGNDGISRFAIGLSRTIIDTGISMINEGEPEGQFSPLAPSDKKINILWNSLTKHILKKSNWKAHQKLWTTDLHIFGSSPLEAFINPVYRRPDEPVGLFLIRLAKTARTGLRHRSIWYTFRNPNVLDPDEVPSAAYEETITYGYWISQYAGRTDLTYAAGQVPIASKYKLTHLFNELDNTYRIYCLPFGKSAEARLETQPFGTELGFPILNKKLTDMNPLGMCPLSFGVLNDQLTRDYKQHSLYGMGIPQLIEGMEMMMEGLFNMTIDNMRLKNTVPVGYQPYAGQTDYPDVDNMVIESGRVYPGTFNPQSLGMADITSNQAIWEWINNSCIWLTGYNFQQLGGDTSKTAYEFAQRLKANSNRAAARLKALENGPLKRSWTMLLANTLSQITQDEFEEVTEVQAKDFAKMLDDGDSTVDDYTFENGKIKQKKFVEYFPVNDYSINETFTGSKNRKLSPNETKKNTLKMKEKKGESSLVPAVSAYMFPNGDISQMLAFSTDVDSKAMLGDLRVMDAQAIQAALTSATTLMPVVPQMTSELIFGLWKQQAEDAGLDMDQVEQTAQDSPLLQKAKDVQAKLAAITSNPPQNGLAQTQAPKMAPTTGSMGGSTTFPAAPVQPPAGAGAAQPASPLGRFGG